MTKMSDQVTELIGKMNKWQAIIILIIAYPGFILAWQILVSEIKCHIVSLETKYAFYI